MKKFLLKIICLLIPIIISCISLEFTLRNLPNDYTKKVTYLNNNATNIETLILGSSHSYYGLNPAHLEKNAFNASHISQTLDYDYKIFLKYKKNFKKLSTIMIPISYFSLWGKLSEGNEKWRCKNYALYYNMETNNYKESSEVLSNKLEKNILRLTKYLTNKNTEISCTNLGWGTNYSSKNSKDLVKTGEIASLRHTKDSIDSEVNKKIYTENIFYLNEIIKWCKAKKINVILFTPPAFKTYRKQLNKFQINKTIHTANTISKKYNNCIYLNMLKDSRFIANDYYDADHLSEIGARKLTLILNDIIEKNTTAFNH